MTQALSHSRHALIALLAAALCACSSGPIPATPIDARDDPEHRSAVMFMDRDLAGIIEVGMPTVERAPDTNLLAIHVPIQNLDELQVLLLVQVEFYDFNRMPYDDVTPKVPVSLMRGDRTTYSVTSKMARAQDFVVRLWHNRRD
jgi:hypothetical protein